MDSSGIRFDGDDIALADVFQGHHGSRPLKPTKKSEWQEKEQAKPKSVAVIPKRRLISVRHLPIVDGINILSDPNVVSKEVGYLKKSQKGKVKGNLAAITVPDRFKLQRGDILLLREVYDDRIRTLFVGDSVEEDIMVNDLFIVIRRRPEAEASIGGVSLTARSLYGLLSSKQGLEMLSGAVGDTGTISVKKLRKLRFSRPRPDSMERSLKALDRLVLFKEIESKTRRSDSAIVEGAIGAPGKTTGKSEKGSSEDEALLGKITEAAKSQSMRYPFEPWLFDQFNPLFEPWLEKYTKSMLPYGWNRRLMTWLLRGILLARMGSDSKFDEIKRSAEAAFDASERLPTQGSRGPISKYYPLVVIDENLRGRGPVWDYQQSSIDEMIAAIKLHRNATETAEQMLESIIPWTDEDPLWRELVLPQSDTDNIPEIAYVLGLLAMPTGFSDLDNENKKNRAYQLHALTKLVSTVCDELSADYNLIDGSADGIVSHLHLVFEDIVNKEGRDSLLEGLQIGLMRLPEGSPTKPVDVAIVSPSEITLAANPRMLSGFERKIHLRNPEKEDRRFLSELLLRTGNEIGSGIPTRLSVYFQPKTGKKQKILAVVPGLFEFDGTEASWLNMGSNREKVTDYVESTRSYKGVLPSRITETKDPIKHPQYDRIASHHPPVPLDDASAKEDLIQGIGDVMSMMGKESIAVVHLPADVLWKNEYSVVRKELLEGSKELRRRGWSKGEDILECVIRIPGDKGRDTALLVLNRNKGYLGRILFVNLPQAGLWSLAPHRPYQTARRIETLTEILRVGTVEGSGKFEMGAAFVDVSDVRSEDGSIIEPLLYLDTSGSFRAIIDTQDMIEALEGLKEELKAPMNEPDETSNLEKAQIRERLTSGRYPGGPNDPTRESGILQDLEE